MARYTRSMASSLKTPAASPVAGSRTMVPPAGSGVGPSASMPASPQRRAVGQGHVPVQAVHEHGVVRREGVHPLLPGQLAAPQLVVPVSALDPRARRNGLRERADPASELLGGGRVPQVDAGELEAAVDEVGVGVDEARGERAPVQLHHAGVAVRRWTSISSSEPTARIRPSFTASASTCPCLWTPVHTCPPRNTRSAASRSDTPQAARSASATASGNRLMLIRSSTPTGPCGQMRRL